MYILLVIYIFNVGFDYIKYFKKNQMLIFYLICIMATVLDFFFTKASYELWSRRVSKDRTFLCQFLVDMQAPRIHQQKLSTKCLTKLIVQGRLASSRAFGRPKITPKCLLNRQTHVRDIVFLVAKSCGISDLMKLNHQRSLDFNIDCHSDTWNIIFIPLLVSMIRQKVQMGNKFTITVDNMNLLKTHIFLFLARFSIQIQGRTHRNYSPS